MGAPCRVPALPKAAGTVRSRAVRSAFLDFRDTSLWALAPCSGPARLVRAHCAGSYPGLDERAGLLLRSWSRRAAAPRRPGPTDQVVGADMLDQRLQRPVAVARTILDLSADLAELLALPTHVARREVPDRIAGNAGGLEIGGLVTDRTAHGREAESVRAALDRRLMEPHHIPLARAVAGGMAIHAARVGQHFAEFAEKRRRPCCRVRGRCET